MLRRRQTIWGVGVGVGVGVRVGVGVEVKVGKGIGVGIWSTLGNRATGPTPEPYDNK